MIVLAFSQRRRRLSVLAVAATVALALCGVMSNSAFASHPYKLKLTLINHTGHNLAFHQQTSFIFSPKLFTDTQNAEYCDHHRPGALPAGASRTISGHGRFHFLHMALTYFDTQNYANYIQVKVHETVPGHAEPTVVKEFGDIVAVVENHRPSERKNNVDATITLT